MVIENIIPKTEMVAELKDEHKTPSYEEFLKNYENDGEVNYDDLSGGVGEARGYGPVVQSDYWGDWEYLEIPCVSKDCPVNDKSPRQWVHAGEDCRSSYTQRMLWSTKARIKCIYCDSPSHISNWAFKCHRCPKYGDYDLTKYLKAIKIAHEAEKVNKSFASMLFDYIADNPGEFN